MKSKIYVILTFSFLILLVLFSPETLNSAKNTLILCVNSIIPSPFPFFVCSSILINIGGATFISRLFSPFVRKFFGVGGSSCLAIILGYISGYPVGAKTICDLYTAGSCSKADAEKTLAFCNNASPMFIIGTIGTGMLKNSSAGFLIFISQFTASIVVGVIMKKFTCSTEKIRLPEKTQKSFIEAFQEAISSSVLLVLTVCGFVVLFGIILSFIEKLGVIFALSSFGIDYSICKAFIYSIFECTGASSAINSAINSPIIKYMTLSSAISWSGLSVHMQVLGIIKKAKLSPKLYFKGKALTAIISPVITLIIYLIKNGYLSLYLIILLILTVVLIKSVLKLVYLKHPAFPPR